jgi:signal transduction histidine kinase/CheY-like chemotaxis protein/streptogramin lyase
MEKARIQLLLISPTGRAAELAAIYRKKGQHILARYGFTDEVLSEIVCGGSLFVLEFEYALESVTDFTRAKERLLEDKDWQQCVQMWHHDMDLSFLYRIHICQFRCGSGRAQAAGRGRRHWQNFTLIEGLPNLAVFDIAEEVDGSLWFATGDGAARYDGLDFSVLRREDGLSSNKTKSILVDSQDRLWFGAGEWSRNYGGGLTQWDGEEYRVYTGSDVLPNDFVANLFEDSQGRIWIGTEQGLVCRDGEEFRTFTTADGLPHATMSLRGIAEDKNGHIWFGTGLGHATGGGVCRYDGQKFHTLSVQDGLAHNSVCAVLEDRRGDMWFATYHNGVSRYDGRTFHNLAAEDGLAQNALWSIGEDAEGAMWFGHWGEGVTRYDGHSYEVFKTEDGLPGDEILAFHVDCEDSLWFASADGGVGRYEGERMVTFKAEDGLASDIVTCIYEDSAGHIWFGSGRWNGAGHGVSCFDGETFRVYSTADGLAGDSVSSICEDAAGDMWFAMIGAWEGGSGGACRWDGESFRNYNRLNGVPNENVNYITVDSQGRVWCTGNMAYPGYDGGASCFDGERFQPLAAVHGTSVHYMVEDGQGRLWFAITNMRTSAGEGIYCWDGEQCQRYSVEDGLASNTVRCLLVDCQDLLWIATSSGLCRFDGNEFCTFGKAEGLPALALTTLLEDADGHLWIGTEGGGVARFDGVVFQTLQVADGLADNRVWALMQDRRGDIWIGTWNGVTRFRPRKTPPPVYITDVVADSRRGAVDHIEIPVSQSLLAFEFKGRSFRTRSGQMVFLYRLVGYEEEWRQTRSRRVEYSHLPIGDYTFEVMAVDRDLNYSPEPARVQLEVTPDPRDAQIDELECRVRERTVEIEEKNRHLEEANRAKSTFLANMSHEIRTPMNAILGYSQILQREADLTSRQQRAVDTIQQSGDHLLKLINNVLDISKIEAGRIELHSTDFDLQDLLHTMSMMFEIQCREKGLEWKVQSLSQKQVLVSGDEDKLRQTLVNLLGNAVKFTQEGFVSLSVEVSGDEYLFSVEDSGVGIAAAEQENLFQAFEQGAAGLMRGGTGLGLAISQKQLQLMGSQLQLESALGEGSRFYFNVTLPSAQSAATQQREDDFSRVLRLAAGTQISALVADDVEENREILSDMLRGIGCAVEMVADGREAVDRMEVFRPDIVFLDIRMPVLGGMETLELLRANKEWREICIVAVSASVLAHERREYIQAGFDDFIDKPFRFERLCQCLQLYLGAQFEYATEEEITTAQNDRDWSAVILSQELHHCLREAAELYSVTELEKLFSELETLGKGPKHLAIYLRSLRGKHDIERILQVLDEVPYE